MGTFSAGTFAREALGQVLGLFLGRRISFFWTLQPYSFIFWTPTGFSNIRVPSPYPKLSLGNTKMLSFWFSGMMVNFFMDDVSKIWIFGQKTQCLAPIRA